MTNKFPTLSEIADLVQAQVTDPDVVRKAEQYVSELLTDCAKGEIWAVKVAMNSSLAEPSKMYNTVYVPDIPTMYSLSQSLHTQGYYVVPEVDKTMFTIMTPLNFA